jgi:hypothetical protein
MLTSAFAESTREPRPAAAAYADPDHGLLIAADSERPAQATETTKASVGVVERRRASASSTLTLACVAEQASGAGDPLDRGVAVAVVRPVLSQARKRSQSRRSSSAPPLPSRCG